MNDITRAVVGGGDQTFVTQNPAFSFLVGLSRYHILLVIIRSFNFFRARVYEIEVKKLPNKYRYVFLLICFETFHLEIFQTILVKEEYRVHI